jgi:hypothetical protein
LPNVKEFSDAVAHIYDASLDAARWGQALERIGGMFLSPKRQVVITTSPLDPHIFMRFSGFSQDELQVQDRYLELSQQDPRASWRRFEAIHCRQVVSDEVLHASEMYRQVLSRSGIEYSMYFIVDLGEQLVCVLSVMRGPEGEPFTDENCLEFSRFVPQVQRATTMSATLKRLRGEIAAARAVMDAVPMGIMVVEDEELMVANQTAHQILQEGDALQCTGGRLRRAAVPTLSYAKQSVQHGRAITRLVLRSRSSMSTLYERSHAACIPSQPACSERKPMRWRST